MNPREEGHVGLLQLTLKLTKENGFTKKFTKVDMTLMDVRRRLYVDLGEKKLSLLMNSSYFCNNKFTK